MLKVIVGLIVCAVLIAAVLGAAGVAPTAHLPAMISLAALAVSIVSAFKDDIFPFRPRVLLDEVVLAAPGPANRLSPTVLLPLTFLNDGNGSGTIEGLTLKVQCDSVAMIYTPVAEIDYTAFITGKRIVHAENLRQAFNPFVLGSRAAVVKCILFTQECASARYPFNDWTHGNCSFALYVKHSAASNPVIAGTVVNNVSLQMLSDYKAGGSVSLSPGRELHV